MFARFSPALWAEIGGLADGLGISMERAVFRFGNDGLRLPTGGCSAAIHPTVYGRNYDFQPRRYGARLAVVQPAGSFASVGASEILAGRLDGMNERGLIVGLHRVRISPRLPGFSSVVIVRMVLDQCASTAEAIGLLRRLPHAMGYNYSLLDADGVAAVVEAVPGSGAVRTGPWLACTTTSSRRCCGRSTAAPRTRRPACRRSRRGPRPAPAPRRCSPRSIARPRRPFTTATGAAPERCTPSWGNPPSGGC
jgi:predicted choloylglycine hydrolase